MGCSVVYKSGWTGTVVKVVIQDNGVDQAALKVRVGTAPENIVAQVQISCGERCSRAR